MDKQLKELDQSLEGLYLTPLDIVEVQGGNVLHGMKSCDQGYEGFGEAYFSMIELILKRLTSGPKCLSQLPVNPLT